MRPKIPVPPCRFCKKKFQRNEHLHRHERTHTNEKPFACFCGQAFSRTDLLSRHSKQAHPERDEIHAVISVGPETGTQKSGDDRADGDDEPARLRPYLCPNDYGNDFDMLRDDSNRVPSRNARNSPFPARRGIFDGNDHVQEPNHATVEALPQMVIDSCGPTIEEEPSASIPTPGNIDLNSMGQAIPYGQGQHHASLSHGYSQVLAPTVTRQNEQHESVVRSHAEWGGGFGEDLDLLWNDFDLDDSLLFPSMYPTGFPMNLVPLSQLDSDGSGFGGYGNNPEQLGRTRGIDQGGNSPEYQAEQHMHSRFASRLPSVASMDSDGKSREHDDGHGSMEKNGSSNWRAPREDGTAINKDDLQGRLRPPRPQQSSRVPWRLSRQDYDLCTTKLYNLTSFLGCDLEMPSRHALCRYIEGYFTGFHEHLPFLHKATIDISSEAPQLVLAIAAVGARYRYQRRQSAELYAAAKAAVEHELLQRDNGINTKSASFFSSPHVLGGGIGNAEQPIGLFEEMDGPSPVRPSPLAPEQHHQRLCRDVKLMQSMILLIALGTWNSPCLLNDAFSLASQLALMIRKDSHAAPVDVSQADPSWFHWVEVEGRLRTKIVAYCFTNLLSTTYNVSPEILTRQISLLSLPSPESYWRAENEEKWFAARGTDQCREVSIRDGFGRLFHAESTPSHHTQQTISSFGNYVLIHCILQHIFLVRCSSLDFDTSGELNLSADVSSNIERALRSWQRKWEATKDSSLDPSAPSGPLSFNSTALFRIAYIRLHADLGPCRQLETRDSERIVSLFMNAPLLRRTSGVRRAVLQCAHALSIPVRIGIEYVARTQTLTWSIVHSIAHLECAMLLCGWLETMGSVIRRGGLLEAGERRLCGIVMSILNETDFGVGMRSEVSEAKKLRYMAIGVFRLWALTFKGPHVFDIMGVIGKGLDMCADMLQRKSADA